MKLICRKCDKEIEEYRVYPSSNSPIGINFSFEIQVKCHGETEKRVVNSVLSPFFSPSGYGIFYFFEKEEKPPIMLASESYGGEALENIKKLRAENKILYQNITMFQGEIEELKTGRNNLLNENLGLKERIERSKEANAEVALRGMIERLDSDINHLLAENSSLEKRIAHFIENSLTWTKEKPTELGWYWRNFLGKKWVTEVVYESLPIEKSRLISIQIGSSTPNPVSHCSGEWAGPIPEPV